MPCSSSMAVTRPTLSPYSTFPDSCFPGQNSPLLSQTWVRMSSCRAVFLWLLCSLTFPLGIKLVLLSRESSSGVHERHVRVREERKLGSRRVGLEQFG